VKTSSWRRALAIVLPALLLACGGLVALAPESHGAGSPTVTCYRLGNGAETIEVEYDAREGAELRAYGVGGAQPDGARPIVGRVPAQLRGKANPHAEALIAVLAGGSAIKEVCLDGAARDGAIVSITAGRSNRL
jgi:hypothetical protein